VAGKSVSVGLGLAELDQVVTAEGRPETLETMLQLLYLRLTQPRKDERAFSIWKAQRLEEVRHDADSPEQRFRDEVSALVSNNNLRRRAVTADLIQAADLGKVHEIWTRAFQDFGGFTFVFVGNIDLARLRPLVETYLGSLPGTPARPRWKDIGVVFPTGKIEKTIPGGRAPKSLVLLSFGAPARHTLDAERDARVLEALLRIRLREVLREGMGAVYSVSVIARLLREPTARQMLIVSFGCAPENVDRLRGAVFETLGDLARNGAGADLLGKVAEQLRRQHEVDLQNNAWWLERLSEAYHFGEGFAEQNDVGALLGRVTSPNVRATAARMFDEKNYVLAVLRPGQTVPAPPPAADAPDPAAP
jgi:zinc protease